MTTPQRLRAVRLVPKLSRPLAVAALAMAAGVLLTVGAVLGVELLDGEGTRLDQQVVTWMETHRTATVVGVARTVTQLFGLVGFLLVSALLVGVAWWRTRRADLSLLLVVTIVGAQILGSAMKQIVDRPRPADGLVDTATSAFPSGHSSRAMVCAMLLAWLLTWGGKHLMWRLAAAAAILLAVAVGVTRVILQVHWATDVLGGFVLGVLWFAAVLVILRPTASGPERAERSR